MQITTRQTNKWQMRSIKGIIYKVYWTEKFQYYVELKGLKEHPDRVVSFSIIRKGNKAIVTTLYTYGKPTNEKHLIERYTKVLKPILRLIEDNILEINSRAFYVTKEIQGYETDD